MGLTQAGKVLGAIKEGVIYTPNIVEVLGVVVVNLSPTEDECCQVPSHHLAAHV
jgi:hypothetical protein